MCSIYWTSRVSACTSVTNQRLIHSLKELRDIGNSVIVVEHDKDMMLAADYVIDMGPKAGRLGGDVVFAGTPREMLRTHTLTSQYLNGERAIEVPAKRREGNGHSLWLRGAKGNNLKDVDVEFPLGKLIALPVFPAVASPRLSTRRCSLFFRRSSIVHCRILWTMIVLKGWNI